MSSAASSSDTTRVGPEIERKFLVRDPRIVAGLKGTALLQGYFGRINGWSVRLRLANPEGEDSEAKAWLTLKTTRQGASRQEIERDVAPDFARRLLGPAASGRLISKIRYRLPQDDLVWEIDRFLGRHEGLWIAEIELPHADHPVAQPAWLGAEVTDDARYRNEALVASDGQSGRMVAPADLVAAVRLLLKETGQLPAPTPLRQRDAQLAANLRANLLRRKQQARRRDAATPPGDVPAGDRGDAALDREDGSA